MSNKRRFVGERARLEDVLETTFSGEWGTEDGETLTPILRTANFNEDGTFDYETPALRCIPEKKIAAKRMRRGDIVLEKSGGTPKRPVGIMAYYDSDGLALCSNFNQVLRVNKDAFIPKYAFYQLRWLREREAFEPFTRKTTGLQNLQMKKFVDLELLKPDLHVQSVVVKQFDVIAHQTVLLKQQIVKLNSLVKSRFVEMFGDMEKGYKCPSRKLGSIAEVGSSKRVFKTELLTEGVPFYRGTEIAELSSGRSVVPSLFVSEEHYAKLIAATGRPAVGDLLLPSICPEGQIWCVDTEAPFYFKDGRVLWIRPDREIVDGVFLRQALATMFQMSFSSIASGTTFAELKIFLLKDLDVPVPKMDTQREFVAFAAQVDKSRFVAQQQIEKLQMLYNSLAQDYFGD